MSKRKTNISQVEKIYNFFPKKNKNVVHNIVAEEQQEDNLEIESTGIEGNSPTNLFKRIEFELNSRKEDKIDNQQTIEPLNINDNICFKCIEKDKKLNELELKITNEKEKYKNLQKRYLKAIDANFQKSLQTDNSKRESIDKLTKKYLTDLEIVSLNSINRGKPQDTTFVRKTFEYIYSKTDLNVLETKSLNGRMEQCIMGTDGKRILKCKKDPITPEKYHLIRNLFLKRLSNIKMDDEEFSKRSNMFSFNRMCTNSIKNIVQKQNMAKSSLINECDTAIQDNNSSDSLNILL